MVAALADERVGRFLGGPDVTTVDALVRRIERLNEGPGRGSDVERGNSAVLLRRVGIEAADVWPTLFSYDDGDPVFRRTQRNDASREAESSAVPRYP